MHFIDLSHPIQEDMPLYPGTPAVQIKRLHKLGKDGFREKQITFTTHVGTHLDSPAHMLAAGKSVDQLPLSKFYGRGILLDVRLFTGRTIPKEFLLDYPEIEALEFVLFYSGYQHYWGSEKYFDGFPVLSPQAADILLKMGLKGIGFDAVSVDLMDSTDYPIHHKILSNGLIIVENLTNLNRLLKQSFILSVFPLKVDQADGMPVRAVAIIE